MAHMAKEVRKCVVQEMEKGGRQFYLCLCTHLCVNQRKCTCEWASKNACVWGVQCREIQGEAAAHKQLLWKGMGVGNCAQSFFSFCCKKINRPFNLCSPWSLLYWPFISSFPSQLFTSSIWLMNMQMHDQFYNSLSFLKTGYKFGS